VDKLVNAPTTQDIASKQLEINGLQQDLAKAQEELSRSKSANFLPSFQYEQRKTQKAPSDHIDKLNKARAALLKEYQKKVVENVREGEGDKYASRLHAAKKNMGWRDTWEDSKARKDFIEQEMKILKDLMQSQAGEAFQSALYDSTVEEAADAIGIAPPWSEDISTDEVVNYFGQDIWQEFGDNWDSPSNIIKVEKVALYIARLEHISYAQALAELKAKIEAEKRKDHHNHRPNN
jgi:hypothetical protein